MTTEAVTPGFTRDWPAFIAEVRARHRQGDDESDRNDDVLILATELERHLRPVSGTFESGADGKYRPAIPLPMFVGRRLKKHRCDCGDVFKTMLAYREHYAYAHICGY